LQGRGERCLGLVYADGDAANEACTLTMEKGWSVATPRLAWPESFNAAFDASLWRPGYDEILDALTAYTNRQTLAGVRPRDHYDAFAESTKTLRETMPEEEAIIELTGNVYQNLTRYLELEQDFAENRRASVLNGLTSLIEDQAEIDPENDADRVARIVETVEGKGLFVPSTILFKRQVLPYRPMKLIEGYQVFETQGTPTYTDTKSEAAATYDFLSPPGYVCRVDFETVGTAALDVAYSEDGRDYKIAQQWTSQQVGGVAGPAILDNPLRARYLQVTAHAPAEQAVLRNTRVFALKPPARATCVYAKTAPKTGGGYDAIDWPPDGQAEAFVLLDKPFFAEAQTAAAFYRTRDMLIVGLMASEPRIRTMVCEMKDRDAALWEEESFEIVLSTGEGELFRFVVNPLGAQFDSRGWDPGWNGEWHVSAGQDDTSWSAIIEIPFNTLGVTPQSGARWGVNFIRNRKNVQSERSAWQTGADPYRVDKLGTLTFK
jgi:hypothetical protein